MWITLMARFFLFLHLSLPPPSIKIASTTTTNRYSQAIHRISYCPRWLPKRPLLPQNPPYLGLVVSDTTIKKKKKNQPYNRCVISVPIWEPGVLPRVETWWCRTAPPWFLAGRFVVMFLPQVWLWSPLIHPCLLFHFDDRWVILLFLSLFLRLRSSSCHVCFPKSSFF